MAAEKEYLLQIDPSILKLLGPNLYTNIYYVLAELIANAYDASAKNVYIISKDDAIIVEDDGRGMSYSNGEIRHYLDVAKETRIDINDSYTNDELNRRKMGRKGIGKLAALSVSSEVLVKTIANQEKSGFILSRSVPNGNKLRPIQDSEISFEKIDTRGTSIVMQNPEYRMHKTHDAIKRNLLKIFPIVNDNFKIHIISDDITTTIDSFEKEMIKELAALEVIGDSSNALKNLYNNPFPDKEGSNKLLIETPTISETIKIINSLNEEKSYDLKINGWIGTYRSTAGRKLGDKTDFPDNFISIFANGKLGEFNILPMIGKNRLNEVYIVGQLHIDLFEETELPDMALSNRQGYRTDDIRYQTMIKHADDILKRALAQRDIYTDLSKAKRKEFETEIQRKKDAELKETVKTYKASFKDKLTENIKKTGINISDETISVVAEETSNETIGLLGIKQDADKNRKKILISQTEEDKALADAIYTMLLYNNVPKKDIIYSISEHLESRVPLRTDIYEYLRNSFVDTYSNEKIYVIYVTSESMRASWGCLLEVGAGWVIKNEYTIFNVGDFHPEEPLYNGEIWHHSEIVDERTVMDSVNHKIFVDNIIHICEKLNYAYRSKADNLAYLARLVNVSSNS